MSICRWTYHICSRARAWLGIELQGPIQRGQGQPIFADAGVAQAAQGVLENAQAGQNHERVEVIDQSGTTSDVMPKWAEVP